MYCLDASFLIDLSRGDKKALEKLNELKGTRLYVSAVASYEFLYGVNQSSRREQEAAQMIAALDVLGFGRIEAMEAAELKRKTEEKGETVGQLDLLTAAITKTNHLRLVTRDKDFRKIPGLEVEEY